MKAPLEVISAYGAPTDSYIAAVRHFSERDELTKEQYEEGYNAIIGTEEPVEFSTVFHAKYHFLYAVQETVRLSLSGIPMMSDVAEIVEERVKRMEAEKPWAFKDYNETPDGERKLDATGKPKPKKGAKKELAIQVYADEIHGKGLSRKDAIAIMMEKVGLTKAGASTYYANCKAGRY